MTGNGMRRAISCLALGLAVGAGAQTGAPKVEDLELVERVSQYGVTWTFDTPARVGQFVTGDFYVVGPVTVVSVDPPLKDNKNGSMLNPDTGPRHGYGECRSGYARTLVYDPKLSAVYPVKMEPGDSLVSTISFADTDRRPGVYKYATSASVTRSAAVLTCVAAPVAPDTFRPSYCGRQGKLYRFSDLKTGKLLSLKTPKKADGSAAFDVDQMLADYGKLFSRPWIDNVYGWGSREIHPAESMPDYGQSVSRAVSEAAVLLLSDAPLEKKQALLTGFVQYGIDLSGAIDRGLKGWPQQGGFGSGRKWPIILAGILLEDPKLQRPVAEFGEDLGTAFDACWTGANVVFTGHSGKDGMGDPERGEYEHRHPSRWPSTSGEGYRRCCNSHCWVGETLAARLMHAEKLWNHDPFFAYVDRWMEEDDAWQVDHLERAYKVRGWSFGTMRNAYARQGHSWEDFVTEMWKLHRNGAGMAPSSYQALPTIRQGNVAVSGRGFTVDGKPFFPLMLVEGTPEMIPSAKAAGINTFIGTGWKYPVGAERDTREFLDKLTAEGMYGILGADARLAGQKNLLGWLQHDWPDRVTVLKESNVTVEPARAADRSKPPALLVDGDTTPGKGAMLGPLPGTTVTITAPRPVTASSVAVWLDPRNSATTPQDVVFLADGKEIARATLTKEDGRQKLVLARPVTFTTLTFKVLTEYPGEAKWGGRISEIQALDAADKPVPLARESYVPAVPSEATADIFRWCRERDASRPVLIGFTSLFADPAPAGWDAEMKKKLYAGYLAQCDAAGFATDARNPSADIGGGVKTLREMAGGARPVFACIDVAAVETGAAIRSKAWDAVIGGASAIAYRVEGKTVPAELKQVNDEIAGLTTAILAGPPEMKLSVSTATILCRTKATQPGSDVYLFAVNVGKQAGGTVFVLEDMKAGTKVEVVGEGRTITAGRSGFNDTFEPQAVHVYRFRP